MSTLLRFLAALLLAAPLAAGDAGDPQRELRRHVEFLASAELEGRLAGSAGEQRAAQYLVRELERIGARPLPGADSLLLPFEFTAGAADAGSSLSLVAPAGAEPFVWRDIEDVRALSFSDSGSVTGEVVFAGYGLCLPEEDGFGYDSFAGLDLTGKIAVVLRYFPEDTAGETRAALARYAGLRYKAMQARDRGALALVVVTGPRSPNAGKTIEMSFDATLPGSGLIAASVSDRVAQRLFGNVAERSLEEVQLALDSGNPHVPGFALPGLELMLDTRVRRERRTGHNVVGYLPATEEGRLVVLGAHYDHLGRGLHGNSLARKGEEGEIHHGADDNASGVAAVLAAGARLAPLPRRHAVVLALWSGEELGLLGSAAFVKGEWIRAERIAAYLNFDMVGRMQDNRLNLQAVGSSGVWPRLIERTNAPLGFDVRTQKDPYLPTDSLVFYQARVPTLGFFTGSHEDYHRPTDRAERVNYEDLARVARFAAALTRGLDGLEQPPSYVEVEATPQRGGDRDRLRAYTGTIPDYGSEVDGLRLSGVAAGGPADRAGLRAGDVIVEFAGRRIGNIYDYTYALDTVKTDQPVRVVCLRNGERLEFTVVPTARP